MVAEGLELILQGVRQYQQFLGLWSTYRGTSGPGDEVFPTDLRYFPSCVCKNGTVFAELKIQLLRSCSNKTKHYIYYSLHKSTLGAAMLCSGGGDQSGVADVGLGNADLDLCWCLGSPGCGRRRSGAQWAAAVKTSVTDYGH